VISFQLRVDKSDCVVILDCYKVAMDSNIKTLIASARQNKSEYKSRCEIRK